jgi:enoyl-CoA hydratase/carnithine racemase
LRAISPFSSGAGALVKTSLIGKGGRVGLIKLNDPSKFNALTVEMGDQFRMAVEEMRRRAVNQEIRACIVTGEGVAFSAGGDLNWLNERHSTPAYKNSCIMVDFYNRFLCVRNIPVPTIAAINGPAIGAGMCMTLGCDFRIADASAKLGFTFTKLGMHPGMGSSVLLPRVVSQETASLLLLTGDVVTGEKAQALGLVHDVGTKEVRIICRALFLDHT